MKGKVLHNIYQPYKWLIFFPLFVLATIFFITLGVFIILLSGPDIANRIAGAGWAREFKKGAFVMALDLGIPLLPVSIVDTRNILPSGTLNLFPGRTTLVIHEPVSGEGYNKENLDGFILKVRAIIQEGIERYSKPRT